MSWDIQSNNQDVKVLVSGDNCKDGRIQTDVLVIDKSTGLHNHLSISETGDVTVQHDFDKE